ncbi:MAG: hypothetical protein CM15mP130_0480 [Verrucomicrobiota bacterium]|nr:MAG: hypothetical protein CM15mP130_0480 [Verrucomicrobiota bacterium]
MNKCDVKKELAMREKVESGMMRKLNHAIFSKTLLIPTNPAYEQNKTTILD